MHKSLVGVSAALLLAACTSEPAQPRYVAAPGAPPPPVTPTRSNVAGDPNIGSDAVFGVSQALIVAPQNAGNGPRTITYDFVLARGARDGSSRVGADPAAVMAH